MHFIVACSDIVVTVFGNCVLGYKGSCKCTWCLAALLFLLFVLFYNVFE